MTLLSMQEMVDDLHVQIDGRNVRRRTVRLNGGTQVLEGDGFRSQMVGE